MVEEFRIFTKFSLSCNIFVYLPILPSFVLHIVLPMMITNKFFFCHFQGAVTDIYDDGVLIQFEDGWVNLLFNFITFRGIPGQQPNFVTQFSNHSDGKKNQNFRSTKFDYLHPKMFKKKCLPRIWKWKYFQGPTITKLADGGVLSLRYITKERAGSITRILTIFTLCFQMMRGEFLVVEYCGWENSFTEIVGLERMRHKNVNPPIDIKTFYKFEVNVPDELRE